MNFKTKRIFFYIAIIGWVLGLIGHLLAITGSAPLAFLLLYPGIFVVWPPSVLILKKEIGNNILDLP